MFAAICIPNITPSGSIDLLLAAKAFSPEVENVSSGTLVFSIAGLGRLMGNPGNIASEIARRLSERGLAGNIGIAKTRDLALLAAQYRRGVSLIDPGSELRWLGGLRLQDLPLDEKTGRLLMLWGIETLEQFCGLPQAGLLERLGQDAVFLSKLARGEWERPLLVEREKQPYEERISLEHALDNLEPLLFLLNRYLLEFWERLNRETMSATAIHILLELEQTSASAPKTCEEHHIQLPVPTRDAKILLRLMQGKLEAHPPRAGVVAFTLTLDPIKPRFLQHDLYTPPRPEPEKLNLTLAKIRGFVGADRVGTPRLLNTHRPDAWRLELLPDLETKASAPSQTARPWGLAFRFYRPPKQARVTTQKGEPVFVTSEAASGRVKQCVGPWVRSGDWWTGDPWSRKEWDIGLDSGGVFRLSLKLIDPAHSKESTREYVPQWFLEGSYD
ncbi:MAG: hypothetical protein ABI824_07300 [Acidobacteriota bacterium]